MKLPFDHFDFIARWYDRIFSKPENDRLQELLDVAPGEFVLDVGGGTGRRAIDLAAEGRAWWCATCHPRWSGTRETRR